MFATEGALARSARLPKPGFLLSPPVFTEDEVDALLLGLRLLVEQGDADLEPAAEAALAKIAAVLPPERDDAVAGGSSAAPGVPHLSVIRQAIQAEQKLRLRYCDKKGVATERTVWPVALGYYGAAEVLAAWCETRRGFRHFRLDRIGAAEPSSLRYPKRRRILLAEWRALEGIDGSG